MSVCGIRTVTCGYPWKFEDNYATPLIGALATAFNRMAAQTA
jgi:hypothetical protein